MNNDVIPQWNVDGVLPPVNVNNPTSDDRSPYSASLNDFMLRFGTTQSRLHILEGLMEFRSALHAVGLVQGFQWIDGSFLENIEETEKRDPNDIDLVTFFHLPEGATQESLFKTAPELFNHGDPKDKFHVDTYFVCLNTEQPDLLVDVAAYWYSLWSHRRNGLWKGFIRIDLSSNDDQVAIANLNEMANEVVTL